MFVFFVFLCDVVWIIHRLIVRWGRLNVNVVVMVNVTVVVRFVRLLVVEGVRFGSLSSFVIVYLSIVMLYFS